MDQSNAEILTIIEDWAQAIRDGDMEGILKNHSSDVVMFDVPMPLQNIGLDAYKKTWELFFRYSQGGEGSFELVDLEITSSDTVAFCHALLRIGRLEPECRLTIGLKKIGVNWCIVHEHHSAPFDIPDKK
jgi:ketosteroid isomerase-like protein